MSAPLREHGRVRVVHVVESLGLGGLERVVETLASGVDAERYETRVLTLSGGGAVADALARSGVPVEPAGCGTRLRPETVRRLARRLDALNAGIVHGHGWLAGALARVAGWTAGVPCRIAHRHTTDEGERIRHRLAERALSRLGRTVCCSEAVRARAVLELGCDPLRTEVVYNGVELRRFAGIPRGARRDRPVLTTVASLRPLKGHRVLLHAAARLAASGVAFRLQLVGEGPEREDLEKIVRASGLLDRVAFLGARDDVPEILRRTDVFVLPTTGREGLGLAAIEAMAAGLPVVASRIDGLTEVVRHGRTGLLITPGDATALERALFDLLADPERATAMGRAGRERARAVFSAETMVAGVEAVYRRDLDPPRRRPRTVLFLSSRGTSFGGGQASLKMLAGSLAARGYRPHVVLPEGGDLTAELASAGVASTLLPLPPWRSWRVDRIVRAASRLRRLAREITPDVVHVDGTRGALYTLALPREIRRVWHLRDVRTDPLDPWLGPAFDRLVAVCTAAAVNRFPDAPRSRVRVVANAVPETAPDACRDDVRRRLGVGADELLLLCVGRVEPQKGVEELVRALACLERLGVGARAVVVGEPAPGESERLRALAGRLGIGWRLLVLGPRDDVPDLMDACDLLVQPSWYEAAPRAVLEAMAAGLPVVATRVGGIPEILQGCGELVPPRDPGSLARTIARLARDPASRAFLATRARERYRRHFTPDLHLTAIASMYDELLGAAVVHRGREAA